MHALPSTPDQAERFLLAFLNNLSSCRGNSLSSYFLLVKEQLPGFFVSLEKLMQYEKSPEIASNIQNRCFPAIFPNTFDTLFGLIFAENSLGTIPIDLKDLPLTLRRAVASNAEVRLGQLPLNIKEYFLIEFYGLFRRNRNNFSWQDFLFSALKQIFDNVISAFPYFCLRAFSIFEHFFVFELEIVAVGSGIIGSQEGFSPRGIDSFEFLQVNESLCQTLRLYLIKYKAFIIQEFQHLGRRREHQLISLLKSHSTTCDRLFTFFVEIAMQRRSVSLKSLCLLIDEFGDVGSTEIRELSILQLEYNQPLFQKLGDKLLQFARIVGFAEEKDLRVFEESLRKLQQVERLISDRGGKLKEGLFKVNEKMLYDIFERASGLATPANLAHSFRTICGIFSLPDKENLANKIEQETQLKKKVSFVPSATELNRSNNRRSINKKEDDVRFNWNYPFLAGKESKFLFYVFYYISLLIDFVYGKKGENAVKNSGLKVYMGGEHVDYRNPMLKGKRIPVTNLRRWAKISNKNSLVFFGVVFLVYWVLIR